MLELSGLSPRAVVARLATGTSAGPSPLPRYTGRIVGGSQPLPFYMGQPAADPMGSPLEHRAVGSEEDTYMEAEPPQHQATHARPQHVAAAAAATATERKRKQRAAEAAEAARARPEKRAADAALRAQAQARARAQAQAQARAQRAEEEGGLTDSPSDEEGDAPPRCLICLNDLQAV